MVDPESLKADYVDLPDIGVEAEGYGVVWTPDSDGVALTLLQRSGDEAIPSSPKAVRFYDLAGNTLRTVPVDAKLTEAAAFSPDGGRMVLVTDERDRTLLSVVDTSSGAVAHVIDPGQTLRFVGWADSDHLVVRTFGSRSDFGTDGELLVLDLAGRTVRTASAAGEFPQQMFVGSSQGLPATAKNLTF